jgi:hypothetical protein
MSAVGIDYELPLEGRRNALAEASAAARAIRSGLTEPRRIWTRLMAAASSIQIRSSSGSVAVSAGN